MTYVDISSARWFYIILFIIERIEREGWLNFTFQWKTKLNVRLKNEKSFKNLFADRSTTLNVFENKSDEDFLREVKMYKIEYRLSWY